MDNLCHFSFIELNYIRFYKLSQNIVKETQDTIADYFVS